MKQARSFIAGSLLLAGLGLGFAADVHAAEPPAGAAPAPPPAAPPPAAPPATDTAAPESPAPSAPAPGEAPAGEVAPAAPAPAPETTALPSAAPEASATEAAPESSGSGLFEESLSGGDTTGGADATGGARSEAFTLGGYVRGDVFVGKVPGFMQPELKAGYGELALKVNTRKETYGDAFAEARLRYGLQGEAERALFLELREAYVNTYLGPVDLRLGQQIIVWGRADAFNPTNNITPFDLRVRSPVEDDRRLGNVGLRTFVNVAPLRFEGVWMPMYVPAEIPEGIAPEVVRFVEPNYPAPEFEKGLGAVRVHLELPAFETSVSYLHGYAPLPGYVVNGFTTGPGAEVRVARTAYNHDVYGFDFSTAFGELFALRGEAAYRRPLDYRNRAYAPRPDVQYVLGIDRAFGSVSVIAQYMGRYVIDWAEEPGPAEPLSSEALRNLPATELLGPIVEPEVRATIELQLAATNQMLFSQLAEVQHMATVRVEWLTMHDTMSLSALAMANFTTEEWLLFPKLAYKMSDALSTAIGAEIYAGPTGTLFGTIDSLLSAGYAELRYAF